MTIEELAETQSSYGEQATESATLPRRSRWKFILIAIGLVVTVAPAALIPATRTRSQFAPELTHEITRGDLVVTVTEQGTLESSNNTEIKCKVRGDNTIIWVVESGTEVEPGDELVRLETLAIQEEISERTKFAHLAQAEVARSKADVANAELAVSEYLEGTFVAELATMQKDLRIAEARLVSAQDILEYTEMMAKSGYESELAIDEKKSAVEQADLNVKLKETQIDVLERFTRREQLAILQGNLNASKAKYEADKERAFADDQRLRRAEEELEYCVVTAERSGLVIYPTGKEWEAAPDIEEGATVHKDQVLLLMPDLKKMQVKVGVHESIVDRIRPGMPAVVTLMGRELEGSVASVAAVTKPAGWWTGNVVKYDTVVDLPTSEGLKPGMSVEVEVVMAAHKDVLMIPTSAVLETENGHVCWVIRDNEPQRRAIRIGDGNEMFLVVEAGVAEGDRVVLDPLAYVDEAQLEAASVSDTSTGYEAGLSEF